MNTALNEVYYTPDFDQGVDHTTNIEIFNRVSSLVWRDVKVCSLSNLNTHYQQY